MLCESLSSIAKPIKDNWCSVDYPEDYITNIAGVNSSIRLETRKGMVHNSCAAWCREG